MAAIRARLAAAHAQYDEVRPGTVMFTSRGLLPGFRWLLVPLLLLLLPLLLWSIVGSSADASSAVLRRTIVSSRVLGLVTAALLLFTAAVLLHACRAMQAGAGDAMCDGGGDAV